MSGDLLSFSIRPATLADAEQIAALTRTCWAGKVAASSSAHHETAGQVAADLQNGGAFLLMHEGSAIGSVRWQALSGQPGVWEMRRMGILPAFRARDLSARLVNAVVAAAQTHQVQELRLGVRIDQPRLLDFYRHHQFVLAAELEYAHANPNEPKPYVMRRWLAS